jgi:hypothetical protein
VTILQYCAEKQVTAGGIFYVSVEGKKEKPFDIEGQLI